ncbi:hypothetical protein L1049_028202 [Liquidambar formosana]|uniref:Vinorine synthase n=1 Tax=Liquidambar formosana TaxID=63359 RepID=A0AAP0RJZ6_LIQFO
MVMDVEIISKETIKPSSPTPQHLRKLKLSILDQLAPPIYIPIILFYHAETSDPNVNHIKRSCCLKKSLAETLTRFYPLAGTIKENLSVDCDDEGVEYIEAQVACKLSEVIEEPDAKILDQFLPIEPHGKGTESGREVLLAVQFNMFTCGGMAIGVCVTHKMADGISATTFLKAWAATAIRDTEIVHPFFNAEFHFPQRDISGFTPSTGITKDGIVSRRFVFNESNITALREKATSGDNGSSKVNQPTRVEAISAFIWRRFMAIAQSKSVQAKAKVFAAIHAVNLRERMVPPLPPHSFGNFYQLAIAPTTA